MRDSGRKRDGYKLESLLDTRVAKPSMGAGGIEGKRGIIEEWKKGKLIQEGGSYKLQQKNI